MKLLVKNIPDKIGTYCIKQLFKKHGEVLKVQRRDDTITLKMPNKEEAKNAIADINGMSLLGFKLEVVKYD